MSSIAISPANLFLACRPDGSNAIKMLDFGISKAMTSKPEEKVLTGQCACLRSPVYMSPEQLRNAKEIDSRADLWSLGVVTYELLSGAPPFDGDGVGEIFAAIPEKDPKPLHEFVPSVPKEFSDIVAKCLQRKVEERWPSAAELAGAVAKFGTGAHADVVASCEQVLTRSKMLHQHTPTEVRRVADADCRRRRTRTEHEPRHRTAAPRESKKLETPARSRGEEAGPKADRFDRFSRSRGPRAARTADSVCRIIGPVYLFDSRRIAAIRVSETDNGFHWLTIVLSGRKRPLRDRQQEDRHAADIETAPAVKPAANHPQPSPTEIRVPCR